MRMSLICFNHYGVGDLWESREFVRDWMQLCGVSECTYACRYPCVFDDMPEIKCIELQPWMNMRTGWQRKGGAMVVNTWIGCRNAETRPRGDYVIWPGVGCTVDNIYRMHRDYQREAGFKPIDRPLPAYVPNVEYSRIDVSGVEKFIYELPQPRPKIALICNGNTGSGHAANFDMAEAVGLIPPTDGRIFVFTEKPKSLRPDTFYTDAITGRKSGECDVLKISYLSRFCDVIVGRCSGAQMVCETNENWSDPDKTLLSFTSHDNGATFVRNPRDIGLSMRRVWSGAVSESEASQAIKLVL